MLALGLGSGCDETATTDAAPEIESSMVDPIWSGCWLVGSGRQCQRSSGPLTLWFDEVEPSWRWTIDGETSEPTSTEVDGGVRFTFASSMLGPAPRTLALWDDGEETSLLTLELVPSPMDLKNFAFGEEVRAASKGSMKEKQNAAKALLEGAGASGVEEVARVRHARALTYNPIDPADSAEPLLALLEREEQLAAQHKLWGVRCAAALIGISTGKLLERPDITRRWAQLESRCRSRSAGLGRQFDHYLGRQALLKGAYAEAEKRLSSARTVAVRTLGAESTVKASKDLMDLYARTGRWNEAKRELTWLEGLPLTACERADSGSQTGFVRIRMRQGHETDLGDPRPGLESALKAHTYGACRNDGLRTHDLVKLGYDAALRGDTSALRGYVERISEERLFGKYRHQTAELELELAVAERRFSDVPALASAMDSLLENSEPEAWWRRHMIVAKAAVARGDNEAAQDSYVAAEAVLDGLWTGASSDALRPRWLAAFRRSALGLIRTRLEAGDLEGAACAARSARARALHLPDPLNTELDSCGRAWARGDGEIVFLIIPETNDNWYVFVIAEERVVEVSQVPAPRSELDDAWWDTWTVQLGSARRVRILASGAALHSPLHQLAWRGEPLFAQRPVTFGLDLDPVETRKPATNPAASVVFADADPYRSLSRYATNIRDVHTGLERGGWSPRWLETSSGAQTMADATQSGGLLVYFGHGERVGLSRSSPVNHSDDVGSTALRVGPNTTWGVQDVSTLEYVPRWAVLLGCDVAFPDRLTWSGGLNLAHAFLLAGTHEVLAASGPVDAAMTAQAAVSLLAVDASEEFELSDALHRVWAQPPGSATGQPLAAFRVWSR